MANKKGKMDMQNLLVIGVIAWLVFGNGGFGGGGTTTTTTTTADSTGVVCGVEPTFTLTGSDKFDEDVSVSVSHLYRKNGGPAQTYSSAVTAAIGDEIDVLWGNGNTTIYNAVDSYTIDTCGVNDFKYDNLVQNATINIECFNDLGNLIDDTSENLTLGSGESWTTSCRMRLATDKRGMPHGGVLVVEHATGTVWEEESTALTGSIIGSKTSVPSAYTVSAAANKAVAWEVKPILSTGNNNFDAYIKAGDGQNPGNTNDLTLTLYSIDCFDDGENSKFDCTIMDEDEAFTGDIVGSDTIQVD